MQSAGVTPFLRVDGLIKTFPAPRERRRVLDGVTFSAGAGSIVCVLGPNGAGKTTLLKVLGGLLSADAGRFELGGADVAGRPWEAAAAAGFSPGEERSFYGRLSGLENLRFFARLRGLDEAGLRRRLGQLEAPLELAEVLPIRYQEISAGMKQRLSLARALLHEPALLILDEPTKSLDPAAAGRVAAWVRGEYAGRSGRLVLWSTHRLDEAWTTASEILVLARGRAAACAAPPELLRTAGTQEPAEAYRRLCGEGA